ncbi:unnamed protein product, partial [Tenebrio molitor]
TSIVFGTRLNKAKMQSVPELSIYEEEESGPCANFKIGDDDLQPYDFISKFRLDIVETVYPGVSKVKGPQNSVAHNTDHRSGV